MGRGLQELKAALSGREGDCSGALQNHWGGDDGGMSRALRGARVALRAKALSFVRKRSLARQPGGLPGPKGGKADWAGSDHMPGGLTRSPFAQEPWGRIGDRGSREAGRGGHAGGRSRRRRRRRGGRCGPRPGRRGLPWWPRLPPPSRRRGDGGGCCPLQGPACLAPVARPGARRRRCFHDSKAGKPNTRICPLRAFPVQLGGGDRLSVPDPRCRTPQRGC